MLPWELMVPDRQEDDEDLYFLGTRFAVARWHLNRADQLRRPPQWLPLIDLVVIAPKYSGNRGLPMQKAEVDALSRFPGYRSLHASFKDFRGLLEALPNGMVHFTGHGIRQITPQKIFEDTIQLEDANVNVTTLRGITRNRKKNHPVFFFNACDVGQTQVVVNFVDGWALALLEAGASGFIGGLWSLGDRAASDFSISFYQELAQRLKKGPTYIADVLRRTRAAFLENGDPTFLAYVYYGDVNLKIVTTSMR
jgi:CHAT domain-containing protein